MTEEEKEGYEELKKQYRLSTNVDCITTDIRNEYARTILNLIEKQQKEIDLCEETEIALNNRIMDLKEINKEHQKLNGGLREEIEELKKDNNHQWEERCRLTFELQETEDRLSKIELQLLEEE